MKKSSLFKKYMLIYLSIFLITIVMSSIFILVDLFTRDSSIATHFSNIDFRRFIIFVSRSGVVALSIGAIFIFFATRIVIKPIKEISSAAKEVAEGNFNVRISRKFKVQDEVTDMAENFNIMVKELAKNEYLHKDFVSNVSHEFKTPLTAIQGYAEMLTDEDISFEKRIEYANIILNQSKRLANLSSELLKISILENESILKNKTKFSLDEQIRDSVLLLQNDWEEKNIEIELVLEEVTFLGDKALMYQVWQNLIKNAIKYSKAFSKIKVTLVEKEEIEIRIEDYGLGMTEEQKDRIFERFYQADSSRSENGSGIGLYLTNKIIQKHQGKIEVQSELGKGSLFIVILPKFI